jgi:hypothetical protein
MNHHRFEKVIWLKLCWLNNFDVLIYLKVIVVVVMHRLINYLIVNLIDWCLNFGYLLVIDFELSLTDLPDLFFKILNYYLA